MVGKLTLRESVEGWKVAVQPLLHAAVGVRSRLMGWSNLTNILPIGSISVLLTLIVAASGFRWRQLNQLLIGLMVGVAILPIVMFLCGLPFNQLRSPGQKMTLLRAGLLDLCSLLWLVHLAGTVVLFFAAFTKRGAIQAQSLLIGGVRTAMFAPAAFLNGFWCFFVLAMDTAMLEGVPFL